LDFALNTFLEHGTPEAFSAIAVPFQRFLPVLAFHLVFQGFGTPSIFYAVANSS
jgi:hypothetical protein